MYNLQLSMKGFNMETFGIRYKIPTKLIYACISIIIPFVPIIIIGLIPKYTYINKMELM